MTENQENLKCQLLEAENRIRDLEDSLCGYDTVVTQRDRLQEQLYTIDCWKESVIQKQNDMFGQLIGKYDCLCSSYDSQCDRVDKYREENDKLRCELTELTDAFQTQENVVRELENAKVDVKNETCKLHKKMANQVENGKQLRVKLEQADMLLHSSAQDLARAQKATADKKTELAELEKRIAEGQAQHMCLKSSMAELKNQTERRVSALQSELAGLQCQLSTKNTDIAESKRLLEDRQQELEAQAGRIERLKRIIVELQESRLQDKCKTDQEISVLKAEAEEVGKELMAVKNKHCEAHAERERLKCQMDEYEKDVERLESTLEQQRQDAKKIQQCAEIAVQKYETEREQLANEIQLSDRKINFMKHDINQLKCTIEERARENKRLKNEMTEIKASAAVRNICAQPNVDKYAGAKSSEGRQTDKEEWDFKSMADTMKTHLHDFSESFNEIKQLFKNSCNN